MTMPALGWRSGSLKLLSAGRVCRYSRGRSMLGDGLVHLCTCRREGDTHKSRGWGLGADVAVVYVASPGAASGRTGEEVE